MSLNGSFAVRISWNLLGAFICGRGLMESILLPLPTHLVKGGAWQFLTNTALLAACINMLCIATFSTTKAFELGNRKIGCVVDVFENLCCNLEFIVTITYWSTVLLFPDMLNGKSFNVSWSLDLKIHLLPYLFLVIDVLFLRVNYEKILVFGTSLRLLVIFLGSYWSIIEINTSYLNNDGITRFPYPFLNNGEFLYRLSWLSIFTGLGLMNHFVIGYLIKPIVNRKSHIE